MIYDGIVVGAGHAGVEAALALAKKTKKTLLITGDLNKVASLPCNPSIGGPAKGIVVREIDALGGQMAKTADQTQIQMKMLNASKGPAVRALRAQIDKIKYPQMMLEVLKQAKHLTLKEAFVDTLIIENNHVKGVILEDGSQILSKTVIITTGTYLNSHILIGKSKTSSGPNGEKTTKGISAQLNELGFEILRLKTGTPPRILSDSVDYSKMIIQPGDQQTYTFSHENKYYHENPQKPCYLTHTTDHTHDIINLNLNESSMYSGVAEGIGPRYCPSIEDKVVRFSDKSRHQIFIEPESVELDELYVQGFSTSMSKNIQEKMIKTIPGLENAKIVKYAYAIEYDAINPVQLKPSLETKLIENLFCAGQINGTSGYEEAAGQGIIAGINAGQKIDHQEPLVLKRHEAYIGVLIDDLVTKGTKEPYRLLTSRAEHRLLLRNDNADLRLTEYGYRYGLINDNEYKKFQQRKKSIDDLIAKSRMFKILPNEINNTHLESKPSAKLFESISLYDLIKRPEIGVLDIKYFLDEDFSEDALEQLEIQVKYEGYIQKAMREAEKMKRLENKIIPDEISYDAINNISAEAKEKLSKIRPKTIGQASRVLGVNPADIAILLVHIESRNY